MGLRRYHARGSATILQTAHTATNGFYWFTNPTGSAVRPCLHRIRIATQLGSALLTATPTEIVAVRISFASGSPGGLVTSVRENTLLPAAVAELGNLVGSLATLLEVEKFASWFVTANDTAVGQAPPQFGEAWEGAMTLQPLQGVIIQQFTNGVASDTRRLTVDFTWSEG